MSTISVIQLKRAIGIREQIDALEQELAHILSGDNLKRGRGRPRLSGQVNQNSQKPKRRMSAAARAAISAAAKARWKKVKAAGKNSL
jgi:hypothetical protein